MVRRPSASIVPSTMSSPNPSSIVVHRATESHHAFTSVTTASHNHSLQMLASATPQQKIVQVLVNRLKHKLPCNSGLPIDVVESDRPTQQAIDTLVELSKDSLDIIAWALSELLDRLAKQTDIHTGQLTIEVLQSQLFILKVLSITMASRWSHNTRPGADDQPSSSPDSPVPPGPGRSNRRQTPSERSTPSWQEPPPLDDSCAKYILSVMILFIRQTASAEIPLMLQTRSTDISFRDFDDVNGAPNSALSSEFKHDIPLRSRASSNSVNSGRVSIESTTHIAAANTVYETTHMSLVKSSVSVNSLIAKYVGRIIFHISASNWNVVYERLSNKIGFLASTSEVAPDTTDLQLMAYSVLDRSRLVLLLNQLSSLLVNMKKEAQLAITIHLRSAIWNWIDVFPAEFNDVIRTRGRTEGAPERVFDLLFTMITPGSEKIFWPTLMILNCISADRVAPDYHYGAGHKGRKELKFIDTVMKHVHNNSKLSEIALACGIDLCRAAAYISPEGDPSLRLVAADTAHELKTALSNCGVGRKPFWDLQEDIDISLYADGLVAIFRFMPLEDSLPLIYNCVEPERSDPIKTCAIRACLTIVQDAPRFPWQKPMSVLAESVSVRTREIVKSTGGRRMEVDQYGAQRRVAQRPKAKRTFLEPLSEKEVLILGVLSLWRADSTFFVKGLESAADIDAWIGVAVRLWEAPIDVSVKVSIAHCMRKISAQSFATPATDKSYGVMLHFVKCSMPLTLITVVGNLLTSRNDVECQLLWMSVAHKILDVYVSKSDLPHVKEIQSDPSRISAFALAEVSFLVALSSADNSLSQLAAKGLRLLSHAERLPSSPVNSTVSDDDRSKRNPIYEQLGDPRITVAGRLGHQKRIRKLVRVLSFSSGIHIVVWEECFGRWRTLNEVINNALNNNASVDSDKKESLSKIQEIRNQWQNLTLFLAALAGSCMQEGQDLTALAKTISPKFLPDKMRVIASPTRLVEGFIGDLIGLLVAEDVQIRDVVREALGSELSPRLYGRLVRNLEDTLQAFEESYGLEIAQYTVLLDQIIAILKLVAENTNVTLEDVMNVDMSSMMYALALFIDRFSGPLSHRIKIKYCGLCESICSRADTLTIRKDSTSRHEILSRVLSWMVTLKSKTETDQQTTNQIDINMSCLRAVVKLLERLQLRGTDPSNNADDGVHSISREFNKYSTALLSSIDACQPDPTSSDVASEQGSVHQKMRICQKEAELRELVITGLTHLVSANSESGFKQCLPLAYDQDNRKRTIFAHVFARVIGQGTVFDPEDRSQTKARHASLCELVRGSDMMLAMTICEICPPNEVEMMISVLLNIFDSRTSLMKLIKHMIEREVAQTDNEASLFRSNSTCTRFLSAFARLHGYHYLRDLVQPLVSTMEKIPPGSGYEIDPNKAAGQDVVQNQRNVEYVAATFIGIMSSSIPALPGMFREICAHIGKVVAEVWPDSKYAAMGAFIFLRFISPAVVTPETIDIEVPKGENYQTLRRGLMVIAKIIQNLANNIFFGKEAHMVTLNTFLESNISNVTRFLSELHKYSPELHDNHDQWIGTTSDDTDIVILHRFFHKHADKIGKELLSLSRPTADGDSAAVVGKRAWDRLCALLVDLGPPLEVPRLSSLDSANHQDYQDLLARNAERDISSVQHLFSATDVQASTAVFVLRLSSIDIEGLDIELFMYHILKMLGSEQYSSRTFDIILDCTSFTSASEIPLQWLKYCAELIPQDIRFRFSFTRILNPNTLTQKYLRRLYNISAGTPICNEIKVYTSVLQLMADVRTAAVKALEYPISLESEAEKREIFDDVTMKTSMRVKVVLHVGSTHIRVTSVKSLPISPGLSCKSTDIIPLSDVSDIYNVSTGAEPYEFIIRRRQGVTVYFSSAAREQIVKAVRNAKGQLKEAQTPLTERFSRFSNVPATLLHIGFLSVDLNDEELRGAAYDLLGAVCKYLKYDQSPIIACKAGFFSGDPVSFVFRLSDKLAEFAPQLTLDFIHEVSAAMTSMDKTSIANRISCLHYMSPWIKNLSHFSNPTHQLYERSGARLRDCIRTLSDLSLAFPEITATIQKHIWAEVAKLESNIVDIILDELVRTATDGGIGSRRCETISHIVAALSSINVRGRIYFKLRKALSKVPPKFSNTLLEHQNWNEISTLIRLALVVGSQSTTAGNNYIYVPEIIHLVSLSAGEGPPLVRKSVYGIIMNLIQSLYISRPDDSTEAELMKLINDCTSSETLRLFGLKRETPTSEYTNLEQMNDKDTLDHSEKLVELLIRILNVSAGSTGMLNVWRARWMSLVTSTAFQQSPAVQTRSFVALAALAVAEVDDDFLYQILVAFKGALMKANESTTMAIVSMLRCMCKIVPAMRERSRYVDALFWLAVALLESSHVGFYIEATWLLRVTLENMEEHGMFRNASVQDVLLECREPLEEVSSQLDELLRLNFGANFSISLASIIFKGIRHTLLKDSAEAVLRTLVRVTSASYEPNHRAAMNGHINTPCQEVLGYFLALLPVSSKPAEYRRLLIDCHVDGAWIPDAGGEEDEDNGISDLTIAMLGVNDSNTALLVASFAGTILSNAQGDDAETQILYGLLSSIATSYPEVISITYESLQDRIREIFANSSNASIIRSVSNIFRVALQDTNRSSNVSTNHGSTSTLGTVDENAIFPGRPHLSALDELGMQGLANNFTFLPQNRGHATTMINWIPALVTLMIS